MPEPDPSRMKSFASPAELSEWLRAKHASADELWVKIFKKGSGIPSITWDELVIEVLCWGWIDGLKKSLDKQAYLQRITPRRKRSIWSKRNTEHVERLIREGRMEEPGLTQVEAAKADGRWGRAYAASEAEVPADFLAALEKQPAAKQFHEGLSESQRFAIAYGLESAKRPETRQRRFDASLAMMIRQEKPGAGTKTKKSAPRGEHRP